jgi:hypothetical protein
LIVLSQLLIDTMKRKFCIALSHTEQLLCSDITFIKSLGDAVIVLT